MTVITATEFKMNLGHYLDMATQQDIFITRQGKVAARLSAPVREKVALLDELVGVASSTALTADQARAERLSDQ